MTEAALTRSQPKCMSPADNEVCFPRLTAGWNSVPVALHSFATRNSGLLPTVGNQSTTLRVAQENVTFPPIGKARSVPGLVHPLARVVRPFTWIIHEDLTL